MSADINKLKAILAKSKEVMKKSDEEYGSPTNKKVSTQNDTTKSSMVEYEEKEIPNLTEQFIQKYGMTDGKIPTKSVSPKNGNYPNIEKSKMPKAVLEAMVNNPIEIPENPFAVGSFSLDDVPELIEAPKQKIQESQNKSNRATVNPQITDDTISVDRDYIKQVVREEFEGMVRDILDEYMEKSLVTEDIHIKIGDTIFGGNLKPIPKKRKGVN